MKTIFAAVRNRFIALTIALGSMINQAAFANDALLKIPENGWISFDVASVPAAANWCCIEWDRDARAPQTCDLDRNDQGFGIDNAKQSGVSSVSTESARLRVYVQSQQGQVKQIRSYGLNCAVTSAQAVRDLGQIDPQISLKFLQDHSKAPKLIDASLATIAAHQSAEADAILRRLIADESSLKRRRNALFWAGQLRGDTGFAMARAALNDVSANFRRHALFVISQSKDPRHVAVLTAAGQSDSNPKVRGEAWFWLAQSSQSSTASGQASAALDSAAIKRNAQAIRQAITTDPDSYVQEHAVFALSQLPKSHASTELIALLEDRTLSKVVRERALFWLAQSEDDIAQAYLAAALSARDD